MFVPAERSPIRRSLAPIGFALITCLAVWQCTCKPTLRTDSDYLVTLVSLYRHASPDLRPGDMALLKELAVRENLPEQYPYEMGYFEANRGSRYAYHFFLYSLINLPAFALTRMLGGTGLFCFQITNAVMFIAANAILWFWSDPSPWRRVGFAGLASLGPAVLYIEWNGPELMCWSLVSIAMALCAYRRYAAASFCIGLAATQNPPLMFLGGFVVLMAWSQGSRKQAFVSAVALSPIFVPPLYFLALFGTPNLIAKAGLSSTEYLSASRMASMLFDLNQGLLPHVPGLVLLWLGVAAISLARRSSALETAAMVITTLVVMAACCTTSNWNSACRLLMRYNIWILPWMAWTVIRLIPDTSAARRCVYAALALNTALFLTFTAVIIARPKAFPYTRHLPQAAVVFRYFPSLYNPEFEIFAERTLHTDGEYAGKGTVVFAAGDGTVTKTLVDPEDLHDVARQYEVSEDYAETLKKKRLKSRGLFYDSPPPNAWHRVPANEK